MGGGAGQGGGDGSGGGYSKYSILEYILDTEFFGLVFDSRNRNPQNRFYSKKNSVIETLSVGFFPLQKLFHG